MELHIAAVRNVKSFLRSPLVASGYGKDEMTVNELCFGAIENVSRLACQT